MTMGILTYVKIGAAVAILLVAGYFIYQYKHMQAVIAKQQEQIVALELRAEVIEKAQAATDAFMKKKTVVQIRVVKEKANIERIVETKNDAGMKQLFINRGLLIPDPKPAPLSR